MTDNMAVNRTPTRRCDASRETFRRRQITAVVRALIEIKFPTSLRVQLVVPVTGEHLDAFIYLANFAWL